MDSEEKETVSELEQVSDETLLSVDEVVMESDRDSAMMVDSTELVRSTEENDEKEEAGAHDDDDGADGEGASSSSEDDNESSSDESTASSKAKVKCLQCQHCSTLLCLRSDIIPERAEVWSDQVYSYQLDYLGMKGVWCYSATNPSSHRFDVSRLSQSARESGALVCVGESSELHSWFPGFAWNMCHCLGCGQHLGWGFQRVRPVIESNVEPVAADTAEDRTAEEDGAIDQPASEEDATQPDIDFIGLILTHTAQKWLEQAEFEAASRHASQLRLLFAASAALL